MYLFVYGTLRKSCDPQRHRQLLHDARYITDGYIFARLYEVADYPAAVLSTNRNERVYGEVYRIEGTATQLERLDSYEGCDKESPPPHEYIRRKLDIQIEGAAPIRAWVYLYNRNPATLHHIACGDYRSYLGTFR